MFFRVFCHLALIYRSELEWIFLPTPSRRTREARIECGSLSPACRHWRFVSLSLSKDASMDFRAIFWRNESNICCRRTNFSRSRILRVVTSRGLALDIRCVPRASAKITAKIHLNPPAKVAPLTTCSLSLLPFRREFSLECCYCAPSYWYAVGSSSSFEEAGRLCHTERSSRESQMQRFMLRTLGTCWACIWRTGWPG